MTTPLHTLLESIVALTKVVQRDRALRPIEQTLARKMATAFRAHRAAFMAEFERIGPGLYGEASAPPAIEGALEAAYQTTLADFLGPIETAAAAAIDAAAQHRVAEFGIDYAFDLKNPRAIAAIKDRAAAAVKEIDATTREEIARIISQGMEDGYNYQKVARALADKYDEFGLTVPAGKHIRNRAELIAINEAGEAYETGNRLVIDEMTAVGLEMEMHWSSVGDAQVSDGCRRNEAVGWIPVDQTFPSGHQHAPRFPGCRCAILYRRRPTT
ncbi:MAG: phage minor head protein [Bacilli bacterium]